MRRTEYGAGVVFFLCLILFVVYRIYFYAPPTCFDHRQDGAEQGVDCGGMCTRVCSFQVQPPVVQWARSFKVTNGQYNAVAYVQNMNKSIASANVPYTFSFYDQQGLITKRTGTTVLPPDSVYPIFAPRVMTGDRVPTKTFLQVGTTTDWVHASSSPNQFSVLSRNLTGADSQPRLTARIRNNALTPVQNVEVVATIFDSHGTALTSSRTFIDSFPPRATENAVFTWPQPIAKTIRSCEVPTDVALAIDLSGSMNNDGGHPPEPITSVLKAADTFTTQLHQGDQAALVTFASKAALIDTLNGNFSKVAKDILGLSISPKEERGTTDTGDAIKAAAAELTSSRHDQQARKVLVLLTDGLATSPDPDPSAYALKAAAAAKAEGITIYTIGLGKQADMKFLQQVASSPQQAYAAVDKSQVDTMYRTIKKSICEDGPAVIQIIPKTSTGIPTLQGQ